MKEIIKEDFQINENEREHFVALTNNLIDIMVDFCQLTLKAVSNKKESPLYKQQIEDVINFDLQFRIQQINDPELLDTIREIAYSEYICGHISVAR